MSDQNLYVLEVRDGIILYLNARTPVSDGWWWGTDDTFQEGPFPTYEAAVRHVRRHGAEGFNLIIWTRENFLDASEPSPSGQLIVIDTDGQLWTRDGERPVNALVQ
jgi:hypothetical protein